MALCTAAEIKTYLNLAADDTTWDNLFAALIPAFDKFADNYCKRTLSQASHTEYFSGPARVLFLNNPPIASDPAVQIWADSSRDFASADLVDTDDYFVDTENGIIHFDSERSSGNKNIKVTYTGGYADADVPDDLKQAAIEAVAKKYQESRDGNIGMVSRTLPDGSVSFRPMELVPQIRMILDLYRNTQSG